MPQMLDHQFRSSRPWKERRIQVETHDKGDQRQLFRLRTDRLLTYSFRFRAGLALHSAACTPTAMEVKAGGLQTPSMLSWHMACLLFAAILTPFPVRPLIGARDCSKAFYSVHLFSVPRPACKIPRFPDSQIPRFPCSGRPARASPTDS
jgi:hypothetical protein